MASYLGSLISGGGDAPAAAQQPAVGPGLPRAEALSLIDVDDEGAFAVNEESAQILAGIEGKLCVVCVARPCRTRKPSTALLRADDGGPCDRCPARPHDDPLGPSAPLQGEAAEPSTRTWRRT